jgi:hypothetical protein
MSILFSPESHPRGWLSFLNHPGDNPDGSTESIAKGHENDYRLKIHTSVKRTSFSRQTPKFRMEKDSDRTNSKSIDKLNAQTDTWMESKYMFRLPVVKTGEAVGIPFPYFCVSKRKIKK